MPLSFIRPYLTDLPQECPVEDSEIGAWFLEWTQHQTEFIIANSLFLLIAVMIWPRIKQIHCLHSAPVHPAHVADKPSPSKPARLSLVDRLISLVLLLSYGVIVYHKVIKQRLWFLLQPCHVIHLVMIFLSFYRPTPNNPQRTLRYNVIFNVILVCLFSPFLGLVAADLSCYTLPLELENWFAQHVLLLLLPCYFLVEKRRRFTVVDVVEPNQDRDQASQNKFTLSDNVFMVVFGLSIEILFHSLIMLPCALFSGYNINYILCPPGQLAVFGVHYRWVMSFICFPFLVLVIRFGLLSFVWIKFLWNGLFSKCCTKSKKS